MAVIYRVTDRSAGADRALKQLLPTQESQASSSALAHFEREFRILTQLSHPRIIEVYDYGLLEHGAYYTMELLDGGDIRERAPLPWQKACELAYAVASSLALLHCRGLVHRDVSPRNVRCTSDGSAKLIDFGAVTRFGVSDQVVGTPTFISPESAHREPLDGRSDLFSLGATIYYMLTQRPPYPARDLHQVDQAWSQRPASPKYFAEDIPDALERLIMSLISIEAAQRPRSAFEVMQRLAAVAGLEDADPVRVSNAYLTSPTLVGRDAARASLQRRFPTPRRRRGSVVRLEGPAGVGRSRMLETCALDAKTQGLRVLEGSAHVAGREPFAVVRELARQMLENMPDAAEAAFGTTEGARAAILDDGARGPSRLRSFATASLDPPELQLLLSEWILEVCRSQPVLIAIDDVHRIDASSLAVLALLADRARRRRLMLAVTIDSEVLPPSDPTLNVLVERSAAMPLSPLSKQESEALLESILGNVPHLQLLNERVFSLASGNPSETMDVLRFLIDRDLVRYQGGGWTLPPSLAAHQLPRTARDAVLERIARLPSTARRLLGAMALATFDNLTLPQCAFLLDAPNEEGVRETLRELVDARMVESHEGAYTLVHRVWRETLADQLEPEERQTVHARLASLYERFRKHAMAVAKHELAGDREAAAIDRLLPYIAGVMSSRNIRNDSGMSFAEHGDVLEKALVAARRLQRPAREIAELHRVLTLLSAVSDTRFYDIGAKAWLRQLEHDSGLERWRELDDVEDAGQRLMLALQHASERYEAIPEAQRAYKPDEAIRLLASYVGVSIAIGARTLDARLLSSLPALLEPFAPLSPFLEAIWQNAIATNEAVVCARIAPARERWLDVLDRLKEAESKDAALASAVQGAIRYGIGSMEGRMGLGSVTQWAQLLDDDPSQRVEAMYLRKVDALQRGDWESADEYRKRAELRAVQGNTASMFASTVVIELGVHVLSNDLVGIKECADRIEPLAERYPGWQVYRDLAWGHFDRLCGHHEQALQRMDRALARCRPGSKHEPASLMAWPWAMASSMETLLEMQRPEEAKELGERGLAQLREHDISMLSHHVSRMLAIADGKLGEHRAAAARLDALIEEQERWGVTGLNLGASYEARARIAIWAGDAQAAKAFADRTAKAYRHGRGSALGARYERLVEEAGAAGVHELAPLAPSTNIDAWLSNTMATATRAERRTQRALEVLCELHGSSKGCLYLMTQHGLRCAASMGAAPADTEMLRFASEYFDEQVQDEMADTDALEETSGSHSVLTVIQHSSSEGHAYTPVLLVCNVEGELCYVGVALLQGRWETSRRRDALLRAAASVSSHLMRAGDAVGVTSCEAG